MGLKDLIKDVKKEIEVLAGDRPKNKQYINEHVYENDEQAKKALEESKRKLFDINGWSEMEGINSTFTLYDANGEPTIGAPETGFFIKIELPGPKIENWVQITEMRDEADLAEFVVHPSEKPEEKADPHAEVKHFFAKEASSTFRVQRKDNVVQALEIGRDEYINNQGDESGNRQILNTLIAEGGWAGFQQVQWNKLTKYLVNAND